MLLENIDCLSDDELLAKKPAVSSGLCAKARRPSSGFKKKRPALTLNRGRLRKLIESKCGCTIGCFMPWRNSLPLFDAWLKLRKLLQKMTKLEKDLHVRAPFVTHFNP